MILMKSRSVDTESIYPNSMRSMSGTVFSNTHFFSVILQSQRQGNTCLPFHLGMSQTHYALFAQFLSDESYAHFIYQKESNEDLRQELLNIRRDEWDDLRGLLVKNRNEQISTAIWMAEIVAAACLGGEHLWRDLGLPNRQALSVLLENNFPSLAKNNTKDMKWKKFFYKQLCEQEGGYVCRAPSCEQCKAYDDCFGAED